MMNLNLLKNFSIIFLITSIFCIVFFYTLLAFVFSRKIKNIFIKKGTSQIFLTNKININSSFFKTFYKKINQIFIYEISFLIISIIFCILSIIFISINAPYTPKIDEPFFKELIIFFILIILGFVLSLAVLLCNLILIIKEIKIKNEFKQWKKENDSLDGILFENIESNNDELLKKFELNHLKMTFITSVYKTYDVMFKIKIKNWKKQFHKLSKNKLDNEFYYFLIFNYNDIAFEDKVFKINDYSYVYKNRDKLFNTTK